MIEIRKEQPEDFAAVYRINSLAFEGEGEAKLVEKLRRVEPHISLVAIADNQVVGHILFSPMTLEPEGESLKIFGLAPMAVLPEFQNQGIGSQLVEAGLEECKRLNCDVVFVLGHAKYYPRFGFVTAKSKGFTSEYDVSDEHFMVNELTKGALDGRGGLAKYRPEFAEI